MSEKRRVHLVVPGPLDQRTGGYIYDARMTRELRQSGWTVTVHDVAGTFPEPDGAARESLDSTLAAVPDDAGVVIDGLAMGALPDVIARHTDRVRVVALVHHPLADETGLDAASIERFTALEREALSTVSGVIVTSDTTAGRLADFGVDPDRVRVVLPGTDPAELAPGPGPGRPPGFACVGTLTPRKGQDLLVRALDRVRDLPWTCVCAGSPDRDPGFAAEVRREVTRLGLDSRITFLGELDHEALEEVYRGASIFVLASHYEGYGMALAEALARGLPVVSTTGGAIPGTVPDGAGILVDPGDVDALTGALHAVLTDDRRRESMAAAARQHARRLPDWTTQADRFAEALTALASDG